MLASDIRSLYESYQNIYEENDGISLELIEEVVEELIEECVEYGYTLDEAADTVEEAATEYLMELNPYAPAGSKEARAYQKSTTSTKRGEARKAAVKGAVERVKAKAKGAKAAAGIAGSIAKDEARRAGRAAKQAVTSTAQKTKEKVKSGVKGLLGKGLRAAAGAAGSVAQKARKAGAAAGRAAERLGEEVIDEGLTGERYKKALKKGKMYSRMVSADPKNRATRGGRGGESDFGAGDRGSGNKAARRAGTYQEEEFAIDEAIYSEKGKAKAAEMIAKRSTPSGRAKSGKGANVAQIGQIRGSGRGRFDREGLGGTPMTPTMAKNPIKKQNYDGTGNKAARRAGTYQEEEFDIFDAILEHLIAEGYADTNESALVIMANMSEEWKEEIIEGSYEDRIAANNKKYDRNRKRAAQRAADRNAARDAGKTGAVPGVGYVTPRRERETYTDSSGKTRHAKGL
jgi:hypothetical protein